MDRKRELALSLGINPDDLSLAPKNKMRVSFEPDLRTNSTMQRSCDDSVLDFESSPSKLDF